MPARDDSPLAQAVLQEALFGDVLHHASGGIFLTDADGRLQQIDTRFCAMLAASPADLIGTALSLISPAARQAQLHNQLAQMQATQHASFEWPCLRRDGSVFNVEIHVTRRTDQCLLGIMFDLSERDRLRHSQTERMRWEQLARQTLDTLPEHICVLDERGIIIAVNRAWRDFALANGATTNTACEGANYIDICRRAAQHDDPDARAFLEGMHDILAGRSQQFELEYPCAAPGDQGWYAVRVRRFADEGPVRVVVAHDNVSMRKIAEIALKSSEVRYRSIVETAQEGVWVTDHKGRTSFVNRSMERILGYRADEMLGRPMLDFLDAQMLDQIDQRLTQWGTGLDGEFELRFRRKDGSPVWVMLMSNSLPDDKGGWSGALSMVTDVTQRHHAESALRASEERFQQAFEYAATGMALVGLDGEWLKVNSALQEMLGYPGEALFAVRQQQLLHPVDREHAEAFTNALLAGELRYYQAEQRYVHYKGTELWLQVSVSLVRDRNGAPLHFILQALDVTHRVAADLAFRRYAHLQELLAGFGQRALADTGVDQLLEQAATLVHDGLAVPLCLLLERHDATCIVRAGYGLKAADLGRTVQGRKPAGHDLHDFDLLHDYGVCSGTEVAMDGLNGPFGLLAAYDTVPRLFTPEENHFLHAVALLVATALERRQAQDARIEYLKLEHRRNQEHFRLAAMLERSRDEVVMITDLQGNLEFCNSAFSRLTGYAEDDVIGRSAALLHAEGPSVHHSLWQQLRERNEWRGRLEFVGQNGRQLVLEGSISPVRDSQGQITGYVTVATDITYQQQLETRLLRDEKLKSLGFMAAGIAHDFNNILNVILGNAELAGLDLPEGTQGLDNLQQVAIAVDRGRALVDQLLTFARQEHPQFAIVAIGTLARETAKLLRPGLPAHITLQVAVDENAPDVMADAVQVRQIILNLATNAIHALRDSGGHLTLRVLPERNHRTDQIDQVRLEVEDTGCGMSADVLDRIFDPFFTTRDVGEGTGLGLSVVHGIVQRHGGEIRVQSEPGKGSLFSVILPIVPPYSNTGVATQSPL